LRIIFTRDASTHIILLTFKVNFCENSSELMEGVESPIVISFSEGSLNEQEVDDSDNKSELNAASEGSGEEAAQAPECSAGSVQLDTDDLEAWGTERLV
jgi:hypothetical protein